MNNNIIIIKVNTYYEDERIRIGRYNESVKRCKNVLEKVLKKRANKKTIKKIEKVLKSE